jgi:hypothetical protein
MPIPANVDLAAYMQEQLVSRANRMKSKLTNEVKSDHNKVLYLLKNFLKQFISINI